MVGWKPGLVSSSQSAPCTTLERFRIGSWRVVASIQLRCYSSGVSSRKGWHGAAAQTDARRPHRDNYFVAGFRCKIFQIVTLGTSSHASACKQSLCRVTIDFIFFPCLKGSNGNCRLAVVGRIVPGNGTIGGLIGIALKSLDTASCVPQALLPGRPSSVRGREVM